MGRDSQQTRILNSAIKGTRARLNTDWLTAQIRARQRADGFTKPVDPLEEQRSLLLILIANLGPHLEIATLLGGDHPDPAQLGRLLIETRALQTGVQMISAASAAQFVSVLSDPQKQTLGQIRQASQVCPVVPAFAAVGVL